MAMIGAMIVAFHHNIEILFVIGKNNKLYKETRNNAIKIET